MIVGFCWTLTVVIVTVIIVSIKDWKILIINKFTAKHLKEYSEEWETCNDTIERLLAWNDYYHATRFVHPKIDFKMSDPLNKILSKVSKEKEK